MITVNGKHNKAIVYAKALEMKCEDQILQYLNDPVFADTKVRIMPDVHFGKGATVGFTATCNKYVVPSIIGVDIGCGVNAYNLGTGGVAFDKLDKYIKKHVPTGSELHNSPLVILEDVFEYISCNGLSFNDFTKKVGAISNKVGMSCGRALAALGTLGGGNHFIEIDKDKHKNRWLLIHTGSRGFGLHISNYYQNLAAKKSSNESPIKFLINQAAENYLADMKVAQLYAKLNRAVIAFQLAEFFKIDFYKLKVVESIHNYIDFEHNIIRKGAISAQKG